MRALILPPSPRMEVVTTGCDRTRCIVKHSGRMTHSVIALALMQLMVVPATQLLHTGCHSGSHTPIAFDHSPSLSNSMEVAWRWLTHSPCCQHSHASRCDGEAAGSQTGTLCPRGGNDAGAPRDSQDCPAPKHDHDECPICQVIFAARVNVVAAQVPAAASTVPIVVPDVVIAADATPRLELLSRGPPTDVCP